MSEKSKLLGVSGVQTNNSSTSDKLMKLIKLGFIRTNWQNCYHKICTLYKLKLSVKNMNKKLIIDKKI